MKKFNFKAIVSLVIFILLIFQQFAFATNKSTENFKFSRAIKPSTTSEFVKLELDKDIYNNLISPPYDLRIFDSKGNEVPYYTSKDYKNSSQTNIPLIISNKGNTRDGIMLDLSLYNISKAITNMQFDITPNNDYIIQPEIKGSDDKTNWVDIKTTSFLYRISSNSSKFSDTIYFEPITFQYLKITLKVLSGKIVPENIYAISSSLETKSQLSKNEASSVLSTQSEGDVSIVVIDNKYANSPVDRVNFNIGNKDFSRQVALFGSHDQKKWEIIAPAEEIYSLKVQKTNISKTFIDTLNEKSGQDTNFRYIKAHFLNKEDSPLNINSVEVFYHPDFLIFDSIANERYTAYFGSDLGSNKGMDSRYNTGKLQEFINIPKLNQIYWQPETKINANFSESNSSNPEKNKYFLTIFIILMVVVLSWFILKSFKSVKQNSQQSDATSDKIKNDASDKSKS